MLRSMLARSVQLAGWMVSCGCVFHSPQAEASGPISGVSLRQLVEVVDFGGLSVSPGGDLVAFRTEQASLERNAYDTAWYVQPVDGSAPPRRLGEAGEPLRDTGGLTVPEAATWSPDGRWIFYRAVFDGRVAVWRAAIDGSFTGPVTHDAGDVEAFSLNADGSVLEYRVGQAREAIMDAELAEYDQGIHIDRTVPLGDSLFRSGYQHGRLTTERLVDNELERFPLLSQAAKTWKVVDLATGAASDLPPNEAVKAPLSPAALPSGFREALALSEEGASGRVALLLPSGKVSASTEAREVELAVLPGAKGGRAVTCRSERCTHKAITDIVWRPGSDEVVFSVALPNNGQEIFRWNVVDGSVDPVFRYEGQVGGGGRWTPGSCGVAHDALVCVLADAGRPPKLERVDLESGEECLLFDPNASLARDMEASAAVAPIDWTSKQGTHFTGKFYPAKGGGSKPSPLFISYYRCSGFLRGGMGDEWPLAVLAEHGIAALCINAAPLETDAITRYERGREAVESAVDLLAARGTVDRERVGMGGLSFGAEVSMWTAMNSRVPRAVSISTPVVSPMARLLFSLWGDTYSSRLKHYWQLGSPESSLQRWRQISPAYDPGRVRAPLLMQMSEQEYRSSFDYALPLIRRHKADAFVFPNERHQKFQPRHKLAVYERNLDWFRFWLQDQEDGLPGKAEQYARWRLMRKSLDDVSGK